jgi:hypothetical protein
MASFLQNHYFFQNKKERPEEAPFIFFFSKKNDLDNKLETS